MVNDSIIRSESVPWTAAKKSTYLQNYVSNHFDVVIEKRLSLSKVVDLLQCTPEMGLSNATIINAVRKVFKEEIGHEIHQFWKELKDIRLIPKTQEQVMDYVE